MGLWILESGKLWFPVLIAAGRHVWLRLTAELEEMGGGGGETPSKGQTLTWYLAQVELHK